MIAFARSPISVPACTASRRMSPVEIFGIPLRPREPLGLRALSRARRPEHDEVQRHGQSPLTRYARRPRIRVFFMKPS